MAERPTSLVEIDPDQIGPNPDNPRLVFREREMQALQDSIAEVGIQVPLSVFRKSATRFVLIDGERRWRCARKLNMEAVPALVHPRPGQLENILTMFNIHNVRVDWDLMPMAMKLADVARLLEREGRPSSARDLAGLTGVPLPTVRRALELLELPKKYQDMLLREAQKPREDQAITADVFVEINKSKSTIQRYVPQVFDRVTERQYVDVMVQKYRSGAAKSVTEFREISRMARAKRAGEDPRKVAPMIVKLIDNPDLPIAEAYSKTVQRAYESRDLDTRIGALIERLRNVDPNAVADPVRRRLRALRKEINRILGDD